MAMERKKKAATESGALVLVIALILVGVNALSYFMYVRKDTIRPAPSPNSPCGGGRRF